MGWTDGTPPMDQPEPPPYSPCLGYSQPVPYQPLPQDFGPPPSYDISGHQPYPLQPNDITVQPTVFVTQPQCKPVKDYLCFSIFTMMCCCLPLGVAALIYSILTRRANRDGNRMLADQRSSKARTLNLVGLGIGIGALMVIVGIVLIIVSLIYWPY